MLTWGLWSIQKLWRPLSMLSAIQLCLYATLPLPTLLLNTQADSVPWFLLNAGMRHPLTSYLLSLHTQMCDCPVIFVISVPFILLSVFSACVQGLFTCTSSPTLIRSLWVIAIYEVWGKHFMIIWFAFLWLVIFFHSGLLYVLFW